MQPKLEYRFRRATIGDCDLLFSWVNDDEVRKNSFDSKPINYEQHVQWFNKKISSDKSIIYIFEANSVKIGMIRLEQIDNSSYLINYSIDRDKRGEGNATMLLKLIKDLYSSSLLIGKVKLTNIGSIKAFEKAGYLVKSVNQIKIFYSLDPEMFRQSRQT